MSLDPLDSLAVGGSGVEVDDSGDKEERLASGRINGDNALGDAGSDMDDVDAYTLGH